MFEMTILASVGDWPPTTFEVIDPGPGLKSGRLRIFHDPQGETALERTGMTLFAKSYQLEVQFQIGRAFRRSTGEPGGDVIQILIKMPRQPIRAFYLATDDAHSMSMGLAEKLGEVLELALGICITTYELCDEPLDLSALMPGKPTPEFLGYGLTN